MSNKLDNLISKLDNGELITVSVATANALFNHMLDAGFEMYDYRQARTESNRIEIWQE